jgi:hypothetical protein
MGSGDAGVPELDLTDAPLVQATTQKSPADTMPRAYSDAIASWKAPDDIARWVRDVFRYDLERALDLAEDSPVRSDTRILTPEETFMAGVGTCVDLCRFAVETMRAIDPTTSTNFLMIEFEPVRIANRTLRRHWLAVYEDPRGLFVFADTKYPGEINGPYLSLTQFLDVYETRRKRSVVRHEIRTTFLREVKTKRRRRAQRTAAREATADGA